jgi:hypothetical protein
MAVGSVMRISLLLLLAVLALSAQEPGMPTITLEPQPGGDASPLIVQALDDLRRQGGGRLVLKAGRYDCRAKPPAAAIHLRDLAGVEISGEGAELVGHDPACLFVFDHCRDLAIRGLTITWDPLPHTFGRVAAVDEASHSVDLDVSSPGGAIPGRIVQALLAYDVQRERLAENGWETYQTQGERDADPTKLTPEGRLRVAVNRNASLPQPGWDLVVRHQVYGHDAFVFTGCANVTVEDVTVLAAPGMAVVGWDCRDLTVRRLRVRPPPGCHHSTTADAMHLGACRGTITVEDSEFAGMGDDALNIHGMYGLAVERIDANTLAVQRARLNPYYDTERTIWDLPRPGDRLEVSGGAEPLIPFATLEVAEARADEARKRTIIRFSAPLPEGVGAGSVLANASAIPAVRVRRCAVRGNRARGMLIQTRDVLIEDCRFSDISGSALHLCADGVDWWESLGVRAVTVRGCVIERCNFGAVRRTAALDIFSDLPGGRQSAAGVHQDIRILDCAFAGNRGAAVNVGSAAGVELRGNRFTHADGPVIRVVNSRDVTITGNRRLDAGPGVQIEAGCDAATIRVEGNEGIATLPATDR